MRQSGGRSGWSMNFGVERLFTSCSDATFAKIYLPGTQAGILCYGRTGPSWQTIG